MSFMKKSLLLVLFLGVVSLSNCEEEKGENENEDHEEHHEEKRLLGDLLGQTSKLVNDLTDTVGSIV
uniref:Dermaseptin PD-3-7 n=1 Tax=Agalychnis dacnicolor TaxID=75988 RepID=DRU_AGADC|nr:RecName: Full=Dermaseptin PD-3-7; Flags: Precursor [Agalychnis dacnicolor]CAA06430.1 dermaseptin-related peptide [Agalychnis dacnicolor]